MTEDSQVKPTPGIPHYKKIWEYHEPIQVELNREDIRIIKFHFGEQRRQKEQTLEILKKAKTGTITDADREKLPENLRDGTIEQLKEQINSWISYLDHFDFYIKYFDQFLQNEPTGDEAFESPNFFDWTKQPVGINGLIISEPRLIEKKYILRDVPSRNEHFKELENGMVFESRKELHAYFRDLLEKQGANIRCLHPGVGNCLLITWKAKDANIENNTVIGFDRI